MKLVYMSLARLAHSGAEEPCKEPGRLVGHGNVKCCQGDGSS